MKLWSQLIRNECNRTGTHDIDWQQLNSITRNPAIRRGLSQEFLDALIAYMEEHDHAKRHDAGLFVFWSPPLEWAEKLYTWARNYGKLGAVETLQGLIEGDDTHGEDFHGLPGGFIVEALKRLSAKGKAELFEVRGSTAVKFLK
mmetsp:Transcript_12979/g.24094  ORF Transcript_12979/g.24094 Transcript_12979/m.24094 type:complete len:144 (+) Transcript_12979:96-527(+)